MNEVDVNHSYLIDCFQFQVDEVTAASTDNWGFFPPKPNTIIIYVLSLLSYSEKALNLWLRNVQNFGGNIDESSFTN